MSDKMQKADSKADVSLIKQANEIVEKVKEIDFADFINGVMKIPFVKIDREKFLKKELIKYCPEDQVDLAIKKNPAYAGIERNTVTTIGNSVIAYETKKVTALSAAAGIPGGVAMAATIPADLSQYFVFIIRTMQELAYLYGFEEFEFDEENVSAETMDNVLVCLGVMFGVNGANVAIGKIAESMAAKISKDIMQKPITKGTVYPIIKSIAKALGFKMTKQVLADGSSKIIPVIGGVLSGGLTYVAFKPSCKRLQNEFKTLNISDPNFYKQDKTKDINDAEE